MPLKPNDTLLNGQYRIVRQLGRGGYGFVYQAEDTLLRKDVAIKELLPTLLPAGEEGDTEVLKRFLSEARATMDLTHANIVRTHTIFPERDSAGDTQYYIIMAYLPGGSLEELLEEHGHMPVEESTHLGSQVAAALAYAHSRGVVHCDLKPANILRTEDGTYMVADFGIAHISDQMMSRTWHTSEGLVVGTLPYMSPEQTTGQRDDPRIDVYALGAVLYHVLTGKTYADFGEAGTPMTLAQNIYRIHNEEPLPPSEHNPSIPSWLDSVILQALRKKPDERMTMAELQAALESRTASVASESHPLPSPGPRERLRAASAPVPVGVDPKPARPVPTPKETRLIEKERRRLKALEDTYRRRFEREEQRLAGLEQWLRRQEGTEDLGTELAEEPRHSEQGEEMIPAAPGTAQWAAQLRRQIEEAVASSLQAADWPEDPLKELDREAQLEFSSRQHEIVSRLEAARERLERSAQHHSGRRLVGPALEHLESLLDQAASKLDIGELPFPAPSALAFPDPDETEPVLEPAVPLPEEDKPETVTPLPDEDEPKALAPLPPEAAPPQPDVDAPLPPDDLAADDEVIDLGPDDR